MDTKHEPTTFECQCCQRSVHGWSDGAVPETGWRQVLHIAGPNFVCPDCVSDETTRRLNWLVEDGFEHASFSIEVQPVREAW